MFESLHDTADEHNETRLFEALTQSLRIFRQIVKSSSSIIYSLINSFPCTHHLNRFKEGLASLKQLIEQRVNDMRWIPSQHITLLRFASRLTDIISICKNRKSQSHPAHHFHHEFLSKADNCVNCLKKEKDTEKFLKDFYHLTNRFFKGCHKILSDEEATDAIQLLAKTSMDQQFNFIKKSSQTQSTYIEKEDNYFTEAKLFHQKKKVVETQSELHFLNDVDIDHNYLRHMIEFGKNQKDQFFRAMSDKNQAVQKTIATYSLEFQAFIKRRTKLEIRKSRLNNKLNNCIENSCSTKFNIMSSSSRTKEPLQIVTELSIDQILPENKDKLTNEQRFQYRKAKVDKLLELQDLGNHGPPPLFQTVKNFYFNFNPRGKSDCKSCKSKSKSQNKFRTISTSKVPTRPVRDIKLIATTSKTPKFLQDQLELHRPILQIKQLSKSIQKIQQKHSNFLSIDTESGRSNDNTRSVAMVNSRSIREKRKKNMTKIKYNIQINTSQIGQKLIRTDPNSPVKKKIWLREQSFQ